jgi:molybdenum cofactor cytidylyltransferase
MHISGVVLAAGLSKRMGRSKMLLEWGDETVIEHVVGVLSDAGVREIVVVTGRDEQLLISVLKEKPVSCVFNSRYKEDAMIYSLQRGISALSEHAEGAFVVLGDQPQLQIDIVEQLIQAYGETDAELIVPSFQMRRGHPWIVRHTLWNEIMQLSPPLTLREFLNNHSEQIHYVCVNSESILSDLDTPDDYSRQKPK